MVQERLLELKAVRLPDSSDSGLVRTFARVVLERGGRHGGSVEQRPHFARLRVGRGADFDVTLTCTDQSDRLFDPCDRSPVGGLAVVKWRTASCSPGRATSDTVWPAPSIHSVSTKWSS